MKAPGFYDASKVGEVWIERAALVAEHAAKSRTRPAAEDRRRIAAFGIDCQIGFCTPGASLFVPGAVEDTQRTIDWLYRNLESITQIHLSLDTHNVAQIFHPSWWVDADGAHPVPFTNISARDVKTGRWRALREPEAALEYVERLEASGKYVLTVWPYHTLLGGISHAVVPALMEAAMFHGLARGTATRFETKGEEPLTENYSVLAPEVRELGGRAVGELNTDLLESLRSFDRVYVFGQAKSHCVLSTLRDLQRHLSPAELGKIWILEDATSPVAPPPLDPLPPSLDFPRIAAEAFAELRAAGMHVVKTTDPLDA